MIFVEGGEVLIGDDKEKVTVPNFYLAETPVTQELWRAVMGKDPDELWFKGNDKNPVEGVSWLDIVEGNKDTNESAFLQKLNELGNLKYQNYKLPSEAMWQFAAQGGNQSNGYKYAGSNHLKEVGWYKDNSHQETKPVKLKMPNELGFYDISSNVWEWCADKWTTELKKIPLNGLPNEIGEDGKRDIRVVRGGSWGSSNGNCRVSFRSGFNSFNRDDNIGFRLSRY